jgi:hypothetical protein
LTFSKEVRQGGGLNLKDRITGKGTFPNAAAHRLIEYDKGGMVLFWPEVVMMMVN